MKKLSEESKMRKLCVALEVHLYSGGQLQDDQIEKRKQGFGLYSPGFYKRLLSYHKQTIEVQFDDDISLGDFEDLINKTIWRDFDGVIDGPMEFYFIASESHFSIDNQDLSFCNALDTCLDIESTGCIRVGIYVCEDAGSYDTEGKLTFYFHPDEGGKHHTPHVHVYYDGNKNEPISLITGDPLTKNPKMPKNYQKQAKQYILKNQSKLLDYWNINTKGLKADINHLLGLSNF